MMIELSEEELREINIALRTLFSQLEARGETVQALSDKIVEQQALIVGD